MVGEPKDEGRLAPEERVEFLKAVAELERKGRVRVTRPTPDPSTWILTLIGEGYG